MHACLHSGENAYGYAALKSLPLSDENSGPSGGSGAATGASEDGDKELAHALMGQCTAMLDGEANVTPYLVIMGPRRANQLLLIAAAVSFMIQTQITVYCPSMHSLR